MSCSLAIVLISIGYAYLLHAIRRTDKQIAYSVITTASPSSRRESVIQTADRRASLIPPSPTGYQTIESASSKTMGV